MADPPGDRLLGIRESGRPGPLVVILGGLHGNEPAGVEAGRRVLAALEGEGIPLRGSVAAVAGNLGALRAGRRFLARDLNRSWREETLAAVRALPPDRATPEDREQGDLADLLGRLLDAAPGPALFVDLHTTSGAGAPFTAFARTAENLLLARALPVPAILGLLERLDGTLLAHLAAAGRRGIVVEGGATGDPRSADRLEAAVWLLLAASGALEEDAVPGGAGARRALLAEGTAGLPAAVEIRHRHPVVPGDGFAMAAGFSSFQEVREGEILARDRTGEIRAPFAGRLLMPLYQGQGEDGFFIAREGTSLEPRDSSPGTRVPGPGHRAS